MLVTRRALLAAPLLPAPPLPATKAAATAMLRPGVGTDLSFFPLPQERLGLRAPGLGVVTLPAARAHLMALLPIAGRQVAVVAFGADPPASLARLDLAAFVGWDGACLRVLALEVLLWQAEGGGVLSGRFAATGDRTRFALTRDAGAPRGARPWLREHWTDMLAWHDGAALADAPPRPPLAGTWQARLATTRARVAARLAAPCADVAEGLIGLLAPADLPPG
jgi:hypothetical protein